MRNICIKNYIQPDRISEGGGGGSHGGHGGSHGGSHGGHGSHGGSYGGHSGHGRSFSTSSGSSGYRGLSSGGEFVEYRHSASKKRADQKRPSRATPSGPAVNNCVLFPGSTNTSYSKSTPRTNSGYSTGKSEIISSKK